MPNLDGMHVLATCTSEVDNRKHGFFPRFLSAEISQGQSTKHVHVSSAVLGTSEPEMYPFIRQRFLSFFPEIFAS